MYPITYHVVDVSVLNRVWQDDDYFGYFEQGVGTKCGRGTFEIGAANFEDLCVNLCWFWKELHVPRGRGRERNISQNVLFQIDSSVDYSQKLQDSRSLLIQCSIIPFLNPYHSKPLR